MARKGDIVALETTHTTHFVNPYRSETRTEWTLVRVASATRDGFVKSIEHISRKGFVQKLAHMSGRPRVHTLVDHQAAAERLIAAVMPDELGWSTVEDLKASILAA